ncbi:ankyrin [Aspergillus sclerotiicarbonarius CBS 121057]|uniref:Ankyrin n=1 Tax=Aspergillus sclerotiicarbonarius (strain CBS 121057 / IBT 28362) TaxID=1448318 RepID=A0A319E5J6_ASPSB|nr:ankyrin [Aspergillus sclerotiicarbonarius CBS 121057]
MDDDFILVHKPDTPLSPELLTWLQPTAYHDPASDFPKHLSAHVPGTGDWLENTPQYQTWHDADSDGILWIKAIAGAGKSVLTASRIARLQQHEPQAPVLFFFFRQIVAERHGSHALVRDWLHQLLPHSPSLQLVLSAHQKKSRVVTEISLAELWQILTDALRAMPTRVYCVADALDEVDDNDAPDLFNRLVTLGAERPDRVKVLVSSRPLPQIQTMLGGVLSIRLEDRLVNRDIARFVQFRLDQAKDIIQPGVRAEITRSIEDRVFPSFLYARLMLNELLEEAQRASLDVLSVPRVLQSIPAHLEDLYSHMLNDHSRRAGVPRERQILILQLATHATRPLRLLEMATVWEFLDGSNKHGQTKQGNVKNLTRMSCGPLLEILPDETVSIIHHSFTEFLTDSSRADRIQTHENTFPVLDTVEANRQMAFICVRYLLSGGLTTWKRQTAPRFRRDPWKDMQRAQLDFPFIEYAACNWFIHVSRLPEIPSDLLDLLDTFTRPENPSYLAFVELVMKVEREPSALSPLHVCAWGHMTAYAKALIQAGGRGGNTNALDGQKMSPLTRAAAKGFPDMVSLLLENGAIHNPEPDRAGRHPLHYAAERSHHHVVRLLLEAGADPLVRRSTKYDPPQCTGRPLPGSFQSSLEYACRAGSVETLQVILPYLAVQDLKSALQWSIEARQPEIVDLLIGLAQLDMTEGRFIQNCLVLATKAKHPGILQLFIDVFATSGHNLPTHPEYNLLVTFSSSLGEGRYRHRGRSPDDEEKCLDIILRTGCDVDSRSRTGRTALHACVAAVAPSLVEKLLQHGADAHALDTRGNTPLHLLDPQERDQDASPARILHALTRAGAKGDVPNNSSLPLLAWCTKRGVNELDLDLLEPYVMDWNIADEKGNTPIHLLLGSWASKSTIHKLVTMGADPNWRNDEGCTPLHRTQSIEQVRILIDVGADLEARDHHGRTLFLRTVLAHMPSRQLAELLPVGVDVGATDFEGNNALHLLFEHNRDRQSLHVLLDAGADPLHLNHNGDTLWHVFMRHSMQYHSHGLMSMVDTLRRRAGDIPLSTRNHDGQTLLHCMCGAEVQDAEQLLDPRRNPIDHLPLAEIKTMLEVEDHQGRRPIHLAAARSEALVDWLIRRGASLAGKKTRRGENVLHIAAAARDSNTLGLLLESYLDDAQRQRALNEGDQHGRTPLHIACCSGRVESAMLLLEAGADVTLKDVNNQTPLHACAEFKRQAPIPRKPKPDSRHSEQCRTVLGEDDTLRVTEIIHALVAHRADPFAQDSLQRAPLDLAVDLENAEMVIALADTFPSTPQHPRPKAGQLYLMARDEYIDTLVDTLTATATGAAASACNIFAECEHLLRQGAFRVLEQLGRRGVKISREQVLGKRVRYREDFTQSLARWGFTNLFETFGKGRDGTDWIDGTMSRPFDIHSDLPPLIFTASTRRLPNLDLLRVIIETFHADVNIRAYENVYAPSLNEYTHDEPHRSALHILSVGNHWWHTDAIRYLLRHGADVTMRDAEGRTPLHIAVRGGYRRLGIAAALLEHGADPNALDKTGVTPLAFAVGNSEMVRLLLGHGGNVEVGCKPVLFEAISVQDVDTVRVILESGDDRSQLPFKHSIAEMDQFEKPRIRSRWGGKPDAEQTRLEEEKRDRELRLLLCRPVHYAAHGRFNHVAERDKAVQVVELLLAHGADPFCSSGDATAIIHDVFNQGGIVEPFLARLTESDLERRDAHGRTLLLAACEVGRNLESHPTDSTQKANTVSRLCEMGADLSITDKQGNNVLHLLVAPKQHGDPSAGQILPMVISKCPPTLIHQMNQQGHTPLHLAARRHQWKAVRLLLDAGADPLIPDRDQNSLLHHLAGCLHRAKNANYVNPPPPEDLWEDFSGLLQRGLDINARNNNGDTPIFNYVRTLASQSSLRGPVMDRFLAAGADVLAINNEGQSLLHVVAKIPVPWDLLNSSPSKRFVEAFSYLMEMGLDPQREDNKERTPVDIAAAYDKEDVLALFQK